MKFIKTLLIIGIAITSTHFVVGICLYQTDVLRNIFLIDGLSILFYLTLLIFARIDRFRMFQVIQFITSFITIVFCFFILMTFVHLLTKKSLNILNATEISNYTFYFITLILQTYLIFKTISLNKLLNKNA